MLLAALLILAAILAVSCSSAVSPKTYTPTPTSPSPTPTTPPTIPSPPVTTTKLTTATTPTTTTKTTAVQASAALTVPGQQFNGGINTQSSAPYFYVDKSPLCAMGGAGVAILPGVWTFKMVASDGVNKATGTFTLSVNTGTASAPIPQADFQKSLAADIPYPDAKVGMAYGASLWCFGAGGMAWKWAIMDGSLPPGLGLNSASGVIYGTPTADAAGKTYKFRINVTESIGAAAIGEPTYSMAVK